MADNCVTCGKPISFLSGLAGDTCQECHDARARHDLVMQRLNPDDRSRQQQDEEAGRRSYEAALRGEATFEDATRLQENGYLVIGGRLIRCPICGYEQFHQQTTLMNTRAMTFLDMDWANRGADTRICARCTYVLWFAR